jgi:hypothetical protein
VAEVLSSRSKPRFGWVLNLDAELELARPGYSPRARVSGQLEQYGARSRELLGPGDVLIEPGSPSASGLIGRAWCPTPMAVARLLAAGARPEPHPPAVVLHRVNHRRFAFELGGGLSGQLYLQERSELETVLHHTERPLLLKRPLAFAGRGQMRVYARIDDKQWSWIDASFRSDGLIVEPLVVPTLELSLHGFLWQNGRFEMGRICVQEVSERGVFRAVRLAEPFVLEAPEERALIAEGGRVATALGTAGYFGPFGIDAYRYEVQGCSGFCALSEINARYTMGFVTGFPRHPSELVHG